MSSVNLGSLAPGVTVNYTDFRLLSFDAGLKYKCAGFGTSSEIIGGANFYPFDTRNHRFNVQVMHIDRSPVSSLFGFYVGGQKGPTISTVVSVLF